MPNKPANFERRKTSIFRTLLFLNFGLLICCLLLVMWFLYFVDAGPSWQGIRELMFTAVVSIFFANGFVVFGVGWFQTVYWYFKTTANTLPNVKFYKPIRNPGNSLFRPDYLTDVGREHRKHLLAALKVLGTGAIFILATFALVEIGGIDI